MNLPNEPTTIEQLPLFPLRAVLFPGSSLRLRIFERRYIDLIRDSMRDGNGFGIPAIKSGNEAGTPVTPFEIGTLASVVDWDQGKDGLLSIVVLGTRRFHLHATRVDTAGLLVGTVTWMASQPAQPIAPESSDLLALLQALYSLEADHAGQPDSVPEDTEQLVYRIIERLPVPTVEQVALLAMSTVDAQLAFCQRQVARLVKGRAQRPH